MEDKIKKIMTGLGADLCGIANIDRFTDAPSGFHPVDIYPECKAVIVFAKILPKGLRHVSPRIVYIKANDTNLEALDHLAFSASVEIEKLGAAVVPLPSDSPYDYWDQERLEGKGLLSMRHAGVFAGLGRLGKSGMLLNSKYGNMMNLGALLTNLDLKSDPLTEEVCIKSCRICLDHCPQQALDGNGVNQKLCRAFTYGTNERGFSVCNCNKCRIDCPRNNYL